MILTKEQCLSEELNPQSSAIDLEDVHLRDAVFYGMDLFAKEMSLGFEGWISGYDDMFHAKRYFKVETREQLFELFLQSINQK